MGRRDPDARAVRDAPLSVHHAEPEDGEAMAPGCEAAEPEEYGVRVTWQSEAEKLEAAEFLVATRAAHEERLRVAHDLERLHHHHDERSTR